MQYEKFQIVLNILAELIREHIPTGKTKSKLAMEYDMSPAEMSGLSNAKKNLTFETFMRVAEMLGMSFDELSKEIKNRLPEGFTLNEM